MTNVGTPITKTWKFPQITSVGSLLSYTTFYGIFLLFKIEAIRSLNGVSVVFFS